MVRLRSLGFILSLYACGQGQKSQTFAAENASFFDDVEVAVTTPVTPRQISELRRFSIMKFYSLLLDRASDDPIVVQGEVVGDVKSKLLAAEPAFKKLHSRYSSWGEFTAKKFDLSIAPGRHVVREVYKDMARNFKSRNGVFASLQNLPKINKDAKKLSDPKSLSLTNGDQDRNNLVAMAAISLVLRHTQNQGLGLAEPEITNGLSGAACSSLTDISAVNKIYKEINGINQTLCTGTFYKGDKLFDYMLTAAHCTDGGVGFWTTVNVKGKTVKGIVARNATGNQPAPPQVAKPRRESNDLSVILFPPGTAKGYMRLSAASPKPGTPVDLVGFGKTTQNDNIPNAPGTLHCGTNNVAQNAEQQGVITLLGVPSPTSPTAAPGTKSLIGGGDSGGPLIRIGDDGQPEIVGVASTSTAYNGPFAPDPATANYVDINSNWSKTFINQRSDIKEQDIPLCTNGSSNGNGTGTQPGIGGVDGKTCWAPNPADLQGNAAGRHSGEE